MLFAKIIKSLKTNDERRKIFLSSLCLYILAFNQAKTQKAPPISRRSYCMHSKNNLYYFFAMNSCT